MFSSIANGVLILFFVLSMSMSMFFVSQLNTRFVSKRMRYALEFLFAISFVYVIMILTFHSLGFIFFIYMPLMVTLVSMNRETTASIALVTAVLLGGVVWYYKYWDFQHVFIFSVCLWGALILICSMSKYISETKHQIIFLTIVFILVESIQSYYFLPYPVTSENIAVIVGAYTLFGIYIAFLAVYSEQNALFHDEVMYTDELTDLQNYRSFSEFLVQPTKTNNVMIFVVDIDQFKAINDLNGHLVGNEVLKMVVRSITEALDVQEDVTKHETFRFGGDEIIVALCLGHNNLIDEEIVRHEFNLVRDRIQQIGHDNYRLNVTISCGVSYSRYYGGDLAKTFKEADRTLYDVKKAHKNGIAFDKHD